MSSCSTLPFKVALIIDFCITKHFISHYRFFAMPVMQIARVAQRARNSAHLQLLIKIIALLAVGFVLSIKQAKELVIVYVLLVSNKWEVYVRSANKDAYASM